MHRFSRFMMWAIAGVTFIVAVNLALGSSLNPLGKAQPNPEPTAQRLGAGTSGVGGATPAVTPRGTIDLSEPGVPRIRIRIARIGGGVAPKPGAGEDRAERRRGDNSGPGSGDRDDSDNSGPGSDNSGPGSENSGPGSGDSGHSGED